MKFSEYVAKLNEFLKENPESAELEVYSATDPEGNGYYKVNYGPEMRMAEDPDAYHTDCLYTEEDVLYDSGGEGEYKPDVVLVAP